MSMEIDIFADYTYGKVALLKFKSSEDNFRMYCAGFIDKDIMKIQGAVFRRALRGSNKGSLSIMVPKTSRTVYVTRQEIEEYESNAMKGSK